MDLKRQMGIGLLGACLALMLVACQNTSQALVAKDEGQLAWSALQAQVGRYQYESPFLQQGVMASRMQHLLGTQARAFLRNLEVAGPLRQEGSVYFITGNRQHEGGLNAGVVALDAQSDTMRIWWLQNGQPRVVQDPGAAFSWPQEANQMISNAVATPTS